MLSCNNWILSSAVDILKNINQNTACIILSAPSYGFGIMDDILNIAPIMKKKGIPVHVDACLGGFILIFQENRGNSACFAGKRVEFEGICGRTIC